MKIRILKALAAVLLLSACSPAANSTAPIIGTYIGRIDHSDGDGYTFTTPEGAYCVWVTSYKKGGLDCDFSRRQ